MAQPYVWIKGVREAQQPGITLRDLRVTYPGAYLQATADTTQAYRLDNFALVNGTEYNLVEPSDEPQRQGQYGIIVDFLDRPRSIPHVRVVLVGLLLPTALFFYLRLPNPFLGALVGSQIIILYLKDLFPPLLERGGWSLWKYYKWITGAISMLIYTILFALVNFQNCWACIFLPEYLLLPILYILSWIHRSLLLKANRLLIPAPSIRDAFDIFGGYTFSQYSIDCCKYLGFGLCWLLTLLLPLEISGLLVGFRENITQKPWFLCWSSECTIVLNS